MKKTHFLSFLLFATICVTSCTPEKMVPKEAARPIDTIVTFDPTTYEETIKIVETKEGGKVNILEHYQVRTDTIITFDPKTYEETIQVVKSKVEIE